MEVLAGVYVVMGLLLIVIAAPLMLRRVRPNPWYGLHMPHAQNDPAAWYPANEYAGRLLFRFGAIVSGAALLFALLPGMTGGLYAVLMSLSLLLGIAVVTRMSANHVRPLNS